jgi:hypothetical protein
MGGTAKQFAAHDSLERADLPAQRRLGQIEPLGCATEVEFLGDGDERAQMANLDALRGAKRDDFAASLHTAEYAGARGAGRCGFCTTVLPNRSFPFVRAGRTLTTLTQHRRQADK